MNKSKFEKLFEPGHIGRMSLKNRLVMPAMGTRYSDSEGFVSERLKQYHRERAQGGVGLIITEITAVEFAGPNRLTVSDDKFIPRLKELAQLIHDGGAKVALQLWHPGRQGRSSEIGAQPVAPSPLAAPGGEMPRELTIDEIQRLLGCYADGARRAQKAGFDAVEIHAAHGYLIAQFLSGASNHRHDEYGGSLENRARFLVQVVRAVRGAVGPDFPILCRINGQEYGIENGITIGEAKQVALLAQSAGVDAIHVSASGSVLHGSATMPLMPGILIPLAAEVKQAVNIPVIAVGRLDPELGENLLQEGKADFVAMGRRLLADANLPSKALSGRLDDINPCIGCNECIDGVLEAGGLHCAVNPGLGTEYESEVGLASRPKRIVVVGGGPAGMKAATIALLRGHHVILVERSPKLGGQLNLAMIPPDKDDIAKLAEYLTVQVRKSGVQVQLNTETTVDYLVGLNPDVAVIATGTKPQRAEFMGAEGSNIVTAGQALLEKVPVGKNVVVIGGGMAGCETAHHLADTGRTVTIVEQLDTIAPDVSRSSRARLLNVLATKGVAMLTGARCDGLQGNDLTVTLQEGRKTISADTFVLAIGSEPDKHLYEEAQGRIPEVHVIGDASRPRNICEALKDGFRMGLSI